MDRIIEVLSDRQAVIDKALELILQKAEVAIEARGKFTIALSGGSTPKPLYEALATQNLPWEQIHIFWGDERYVPPDHPDSNQKMARQAWLDRVPIPASNIHPMSTTLADPAAAATAHERELKDFFDLSSGEIPEFDLILLGIGDDAHTASLFPHTEALQVSDRLVTVGFKDGQPRLTLTVPVLNHAKCVVFVVTGSSKQPALAQIFAPTGDELTYPARLIRPKGELWWILDQAAGERYVKTDR
ncbi:6-phosphogluconolactonase [Merismopedia glauca]|uniref:6-phosphogluconolactonase n=1 Tax=Merismopedia glauca CCAP 1448/3 TaxID=1296344 RepID=A0A2T1C0Z9_9CYAN|nr:6-phosphogluconolactonase [Merismopedia glauca]PSB01803.1 6-phosphogluconolactonase [Merismopedia glauca CCAP 1448/3]